MIKRNSNGDIVKTGNMIVSFQDEVPEYVYIGCLRYRVRPYVPRPMRCVKCQGFGHTASHCRRQTRCVRCGQGHTVENCPVKDDLSQAVCVNCKGHHSAAFRGCSKYQEVSKALKVSVENKVSYRDALMQVVLCLAARWRWGRDRTSDGDLDSGNGCRSTDNVETSSEHQFQPSSEQTGAVPVNNPGRPVNSSLLVANKLHVVIHLNCVCNTVESMLESISLVHVTCDYYLEPTTGWGS